MGKTPQRITATNIKTVVGGAAVKQLSKEEAELPYACDICEKRFKSSQGLSGHMMVHKVQTPSSPDVLEHLVEQDEDPLEWVTRYARGGVIGDLEIVRKLAGQKRVAFFINASTSNNDLFYEMGMNGQHFSYPVEQYLELPEDVVKQIKSNHQETEFAKRQGLANRSPEMINALTR
jgi:hypothetical protein